MKSKSGTIIIILPFMILGFAGFLNFESGNAQAPPTFVSGTVYDGSGGLWTIAGSPYIVVGNVTVPTGQTLTIDPGVEVKFDGFYGLYVNGNLWVEGNQIQRVVFTSNSSAPNYGDWYGIQINSSGHTDVRYAEVKYAHYGIHLKSSGNNITNNIITRIGIFGEFGKGIYVENSSNNFISDNNIIYGDIAGTSAGIFLSNSSGNTIMNNMVSDFVWGIALFQSSNNLIGHNTPSWNIGVGILAEGSGNEVINNYATHQGIGISVGGSYNVIANNNASSNAGAGGILVGGSYNSILNNSILDNNEFGIWMYKSLNSQVTNNNVVSNGFGIDLNISSENIIYHNNFISNTIQALDNSNNNHWNDTYPPEGIGGNYWSDYLGIDDYCDPAQSTGPGCPDGFGDSPYVIDGDSQDNYPLMSQILDIGPDIIPPKPPTNVNARLEGLYFRNVNISWDLSQDDALDVTKYEIFYGTTYNKNGEGYVLLDSVQAGISYYVHKDTGKGNPNNYFYYVQAVDFVYNPGKNDTQVAKFNRYLPAGKHLISIPLILENNTLDFALQTLNFDIAWFYNNTDILDPWKSYNPSKLYNDLTRINRTMALWVNVTGNSNLTIAGIVPTLTNIELKAGWNFVGYPSFIERNVSEALSGVAYKRVEAFNPDAPPQYLELLSDNDLMQAGFGYWIKVSADATWIVSN